ncbi:MAG: hemerythrin domain-containing protein [Inquilinus sp.]|nr:hemerythrin domain-containing protein [Inquilinus sp.]
MPAVIDTLRREHANMAKLLRILERHLDTFDASGSPDYDVVAGIVDYLHDWSGQWHHPKEDLVLAKLRLRDPAAADRVGDLERDHQALAEQTVRFREAIAEIVGGEELPRDQVSQMAHGFLNAERRHMAGEEKVFLPAAERALTAEDWAEIAMRVGDPKDPLFGHNVEKRFEALRRDLVELDRAEQEAAGA